MDIIERDPEWRVYGVGIIQQSNVVRAMEQLGVLDRFISAAFGFDAVEIYAPDGTRVARIPSPRLVEGRPANVGIGRPALQAVLADIAAGPGGPTAAAQVQALSPLLEHGEVAAVHAGFTLVVLGAAGVTG